MPVDLGLKRNANHPASVRDRTPRRVVAASFIGNFVEWFDYAVYGYLATTIASVFFPTTDRHLALLFTLALIPSYALIGLWAPALLLIVRVLQGFSASACFAFSRCRPSRCSTASTSPSSSW